LSYGGPTTLRLTSELRWASRISLKHYSPFRSSNANLSEGGSYGGPTTLRLTSELRWASRISLKHYSPFRSSNANLSEGGSYGGVKEIIYHIKHSLDVIASEALAERGNL